MVQASRHQADHIATFPLPSDPGPYSSDQWQERERSIFTSDQYASQGPLVRYLKELEVSDNTSTTVWVDSGAGFVNGHWLHSDEKEAFVVPAGPAAPGRIDRVVMVENNTNAEVTQTAAARPLMFPNDLSEYTATPGVPAYSARLAIVRGDNAHNLPAIDQLNTVYMVELYRYDINNVPTISSQDDYREFCLFSSTIGKRHFFVTPLCGYNESDLVDAPLKPGVPVEYAQVEMIDNKFIHAYGTLMIPTDFHSGLTITSVLMPQLGGDIRAQLNVRYGACGENYDTHFYDGPITTVPILASPMQNCILPTSPAAPIPSIGDNLYLQFIRSGNDVLDTLASTVFFLGWVVEYFAKS